MTSQLIEVTIKLCVVSQTAANRQELALQAAFHDTHILGFRFLFLTNPRLSSRLQKLPVVKQPLSSFWRTVKTKRTPQRQSPAILFFQSFHCVSFRQENGLKPTAGVLTSWLPTMTAVLTLVQDSFSDSAKRSSRKERVSSKAFSKALLRPVVKPGSDCVGKRHLVQVVVPAWRRVEGSVSHVLVLTYNTFQVGKKSLAQAVFENSSSSVQLPCFTSVENRLSSVQGFPFKTIFKLALASFYLRLFEVTAERFRPRLKAI